MGTAHQTLGLAVRQARDQAKTILNTLEGQGHPETARSSALYLALVTIQKRLLATDPPPPPLTEFIAQLEQLTQDCTGKLTSIKTLIDNAVRVARGAKA
ncbi:MAG TPA: hypothetical protein VH137_06920 [Gemmatimonadales bacterium]|jgi:hypothetical protein|nr:hypothetical protein [Gemmatimonadales bacterium]